jgi:hypothetical protein
MCRYFRDSLSRACCIFTACVFFFYFIGYYASAAKQPAMTAGMIIALFIASLFFSFSAAILNIKKLPRALAYALHCFCCVGAVFLLYIIVLGNGGTPAGKMVCIVLTAVAYTVIMLLRGLIVGIINGRKDS